jgi:hypothetical protein
MIPKTDKELTRRHDSKNRQCDGNKNKKQQKIQAKVHKTLHTKNKYMCNKKHEPLIPGVFQTAKQPCSTMNMLRVIHVENQVINHE